MSLARNIRWLLDPNASDDPAERVPVEYHLLSWRGIYDGSLSPVELDKWDAGARVVDGGHGFFNVTLITYASDGRPQRLCLSFDCPRQTTTYTLPGRQVMVVAPPIERVSLDFIALLSVFAREPLVPLGLRRVGNNPVYELPLNTFPPRPQGLSRPRSVAIDSPGFVAILRGLGPAPDDLVNAVMAAAKFYHAGLSVLALDMSVAYISLVSAIECLAAHRFKGPIASFEQIQSLDTVRQLLDQIPAAPGVEASVSRIKEELLKRERFLRRKFVAFLSEFPPQSLWRTPDPLYDDPSIPPPMTRDDFEGCLREAYDQRSRYLHGGVPFPAHAMVGLREMLPVEAMIQYVALQGKDKYLPPFVWFERLVHLAIVEYLRASLAPDDGPGKQDGGQ
ncbi:MAG TPA: hypothetical protein VM537_30315 [Anaerolineae bacterium]|nr:hypothetical protein [Anaerolineae bacterium]